MVVHILELLKDWAKGNPALLLSIFNFLLILATIWLAYETRNLVKAQWRPHVHAYLVKEIDRSSPKIVKGYRIYIQNLGKGPALEVEISLINGKLDLLEVNQHYNFWLGIDEFNKKKSRYLEVKYKDLNGKKYVFKRKLGELYQKVMLT